MLFSFKQGTKVLVGMLPVTLPSDTEFDIPGVKNPDQMAKVLVQAGQQIFSDHVAALNHTEKVKREGKEIEVEVSYGAGGARVETPTGN